MDERLRMVIAHGSDETLRDIETSLSGGHEVVACCGTVAELRRLAHQKDPDLIVTGITFPDGDGLETMIAIGDEDPTPAVIVTSRRSMSLVTKAMRDHVMAYLIEPVTPEDLQAAVVVAWSRFRQLQELERQVGDLRQALQDRKMIERAKGVLMAAEHMSEGEAFGALRRAAQDQRTTIVAIAERVLARAKRALDHDV